MRNRSEMRPSPRSVSLSVPIFFTLRSSSSPSVTIRFLLLWILSVIEHFGRWLWSFFPLLLLRTVRFYIVIEGSEFGCWRMELGCWRIVKVKVEDGCDAVSDSITHWWGRRVKRFCCMLFEGLRGWSSVENKNSKVMEKLNQSEENGRWRWWKNGMRVKKMEGEGDEKWNEREELFSLL